MTGSVTFLYLLMPTKAKNKKTAGSRGKKNREKNKSFLIVLRKMFLPLLLLLLIFLSLAAAFYTIFLHTPTKPLF